MHELLVTFLFCIQKYQIPLIWPIDSSVTEKYIDSNAFVWCLVLHWHFPRATSYADKAT